jgi:hypothetical protein
MPDTIARQLEHLAELHAEGVLTDDEFASAKANALGPPATPSTADPVLAAPRPDISPKMVWVLIVIAAFTIGVSIMGLSAGFEWAPPQQLAAPVVCPGSDLVAKFDVSYTVAAKGVNLASVCVEDGHATRISDWWLSTVMTIEYTLIFLAIFVVWRVLWLRKEARREPVATWSAGSEPTGTGSSDDA